MLNAGTEQMFSTVLFLTKNIVGLFSFRRIDLTSYNKQSCFFVLQFICQDKLTN